MYLLIYAVKPYRRNCGSEAKYAGSAAVSAMTTCGPQRPFQLFLDPAWFIAESGQIQTVASASQNTDFFTTIPILFPLDNKLKFCTLYS